MSTEFGTLPGAMACDAIACHLPYNFTNAVKGRTEWPVSRLLDEPVPIWALALHGLVMHQAYGGPTWRNATDAIAWGAVVRDEWSIRPLPMHGVRLFDQTRLQRTKALFDLCTRQFGHLIVEELTACDLSTPGVVRTAFADGTQVEADHPAGQLRVNGQIVTRPDALCE